MTSSRSTSIRHNLLILGAVAAFTGIGGAMAAQHVAGSSSQEMLSAGSSAHLADHIAQFSGHLYVVTDATPAQKAQLDPILRQASGDLAALHGQLGDSHQRMLSALMQTPVNRGALENARTEHMRVADQASRRMSRLAADIFDVLTPGQRKALAERIAQHHAAGHMGFHGA